MFDYTKNNIKEISEKIKRTGFIFRLIGLLFPIGYLVFLIAADIGFLTANIAMLALSVLYFCFFLFMEWGNFKGKTKRKVKKWVRTFYRHGKRIIRLILFIIPTYGVAVTVKDFSPLALIMLIITILGIIWEIIWNVLLSIGKKAVKTSKQNLFNNFKRDFSILRSKNNYEDPNDFSDYGDIQEED